MTAIANLPDLRPSLLLDFANSGRVDPRIQCQRASTATCFGPDGKMRVVPANVPRIDYDPITGKCLGLLLEEARTNYATSLLAGGSVPHVPTYSFNNFLPKLIDGRTSSNYCEGATDAYNAAGTRANMRATLRGTLGEKYCISVYLCGVAGGAKAVKIYAGIDSSTLVNEVTVNLVEGAWRRYSVAIDIPIDSPSTTVNIRIAGSGGSNTLQSFGIDLLQIESGSFPTSYIPTDGVAATRAADSCYMSFDNKGSDVTVVLGHIPSVQRVGWLVQLDGGSSSNRLRAALTASGQLSTYKTIDGDDRGLINALPEGSPAEIRVAVAFGADSFGRGWNGVSGRSPTSFIGIPVTSVLRIGSSHTGVSQPNGHIGYLSVYRYSATVEQLQRLTA